MKVLIVVNSYFSKGNGLAQAIRRNVVYLKKHKVDVRVLTLGNSFEKIDYPLKESKIPIFNNLIKKQGYAFAKFDKNVIIEALKWADVVHLEEPFILQGKVANLAKTMNVPCVATYHVHPENLFSSVGLGKFKKINIITLKIWKKRVYDKCKIIQCPSENVKIRLEKNNFKSQLRVISNGLIPKKDVAKSYNDKKGKYQILCVGRYSNEKDQITLLKSMKYSKYSNKIQLVFAGRGPIEKKLKKEAKKLVSSKVLTFQPVFNFYTYDELMNIADNSDLYIHCSIVEVEGLSCLEVIKEGVVPIIASGRLTATSQFALSKMSIYNESDEKDLAKKIDYWLDNDKLRSIEAKKYLSMDLKYNIENSIEDIIKMYNDVLK